MQAQGGGLLAQGGGNQNRVISPDQKAPQHDAAKGVISRQMLDRC